MSNTVSGAISGPATAAGYGLIALAVLFGIVVARRRLAAGTTSAAAGDLDRAPYAIAYLNGGPERALMAVIGAMHVAGTIVAQGNDIREVCAEGRLDVNASKLERAIHRTSATPICWDYLDADPTVSTELEQLRRELEEAGLLLSGEQQRRINHTGWWMVPVAVLGLPVAAVTGESSSAVAVAGLLILALFAAIFLLDSAPRLSRRGTARMHALRVQYTALDPRMRPGSKAYGPAHAGVMVGIFGATALREADPDFADLLAAGYPRYSLPYSS
jgi:uncharacterized protein (TIGR04222 family)